MLNVDPSGAARAEVTVQNTSQKEAPHLRHILTSFGLHQPEGKSPITIEGGADSLKPLDSEHLTLKIAKGTKLEPGTYQGSFIVIGGDLTNRNAIQVVVGDLAGPTQPLVPKVSLRAYRNFPFVNCWMLAYWFEDGIPLKARIDPEHLGLAKTPRLGVLKRDFVGSVPVFWDGDLKRASAEQPSLGLKLPYIPVAGKYEGTIQLDKDSASNVTVTLNASDLIIYPLIWLAICILIATKLKSWMGGGRQLTQWRLQVLGAQENMNSAEKDFRGAAPLESRNFSLHDAFLEQAHTIWINIDKLRANLLGTLDTASPVFQAVTTAVPDLEAAPGAWVAFAKKLTDLRHSLDQAPRGPAPAGLSPEPEMLHHSEALLKSRALTLEQFKTLQMQAVSQNDFVGVWSDLWNAADRVFSDMVDFRQAQAAFAVTHGDDIRKVVDAVVEARAKLWLLDGTDDAANKAVKDAVQAAEVSYSELLTNAKGATPTTDATFSILSRRRRGPEPAQTIQPWQPSALNERDLRNKLTSTDLATGLLAFVLAVLSGLGTYYFGQPFGTVADYVKLTLWAFGAKITVDALSGGIERLFR